MRALRRHQRESRPSPFVFVSERGAPLTAPGFSRMVERAAVAAGLGIKAHAHMLRHACGYKLANDGVDTRSLQAYLGHRNIQNTTRYTALASDRFKTFLERLGGVLTKSGDSHRHVSCPLIVRAAMMTDMWFRQRLPGTDFTAFRVPVEICEFWQTSARPRCRESLHANRKFCRTPDRIQKQLGNRAERPAL